MWDLEYLFLFGVPDNKWEILRGRSRWAFPFLTREVAEAHFALWAETFSVGVVVVRPVRERSTANGSPRRILRCDGIEMTLYSRPSSFDYR